MLDISQKYELLILLPLTATDNELKIQAGKAEERLRSSGATVAASAAFTKGRLAYPVAKMNQGYYHLIQFEMDQKAVAEFRKTLLLSGEMTRFYISKVAEFKPFAPLAHQIAEGHSTYVARTMESAVISKPASATQQTKTIAEDATKIFSPLPSALIQEKTTTAKPSEQHSKVSMEELDKRLEEILGG